MFRMLILFTLVAQAEPPKEKDKELSAEAIKELKKLEGKWLVVKVAAEGKESEANDKDVHFVFKGTEVRLMSGDKGETLLITALDSTTDPKCIDFLEKREGRPDRTLEGVYKIDGDKLQIALSVLKEGKNRPTSFEKPGDRAFVWTFKRVKE